MLRDGHSAEYKEAQKTHILATVKNVFENLRDSKSKQVFTGESIEYWRKAQEIEKEAEAFYRQKAAEVQLRRTEAISSTRLRRRAQALGHNAKCCPVP